MSWNHFISFVIWHTSTSLIMCIPNFRLPKRATALVFIRHWLIWDPNFFPNFAVTFDLLSHISVCFTGADLYSHDIWGNKTPYVAIQLQYVFRYMHLINYVHI